MLLDAINRIPEGYSEVLYKKKKYSVTKDIYNNGKSFKIYAKELQGNDFISLNYYITSTAELLKPCEMSDQKVISFLMQLKPV
ncbi:peptide methionine sulfoxide reductase [uncultured Aquimarina sp.]|uniref:peptide methionine sulfoxide reductase n=1 Tax=uncultured Aquimarina sp. TaxID=575652 RepID=UPI0026205552|nr:peptide methionine sulfoxide reductase [uncultured Aquimarina sp.]